MAKKNEKKLNIFILTIGLIIFIVAVFFLFFKETKAPQNESRVDQTLQTEQEEQPKLNPDTKIEAVTKDTTTKTNTTDLKMPVLMYHYIRTVTDPNDKLGIGLSVVPTKFASQLDYIQEKGYKTITFQDIDQNKIPEKPIILTFDDGYEDFYTTAYPELKKRGMTAVIYIIANNDGGQYMTQPQIKELSDNGIEVGSHTLSHIDLSKATDTKATTEIVESKNNLEKIIGKSVISFCYPSGKYTQNTISIVKNSGYKYATTTNPGLTLFDSTFELARDRMNGDTNIEKYIK